ncbi:MAG TPA: endolytic transglycosylase MltG, partial [Aggregatilineales bacterium]|nr:endolytic transglycosylase MltG [Aggregatilineales bacterium]
MSDNLDLKNTLLGRRPGGCRLLIVALAAAFALVICGLIALILLIARSPNPRLNLFEGAALRVMLGLKSSALQATASADTTSVRFVIDPGDTASTIGARLVTAGFIMDADLFRNYVRYYGIDSQLQAGTYFLKKSETLPEIAKTLTNAGANSVTVQAIEGWRHEQIAAAIDANPALSFKGA